MVLKFRKENWFEDMDLEAISSDLIINEIARDTWAGKRRSGTEQRALTFSKLQDRRTH